MRPETRYGRPERIGGFRFLNLFLAGLFISNGIRLAAAEELAAAGPQRDLTELPLEELMNLPVTLVSKTPKRWSESAAAIHVITQEDIRRSGVTSIPEAFRLAPGMQVGKVDSHTWAVSARGFNDVFANKLLVLQDGRSIYTPLFSGTFWDVQDTLLEDIDRIEIIRGPGSSLWGANAVNGVINIITKTARETQGLLVSGGGGTEETGFGAVRYGGKLGAQTYYRVYGKYFNRDDSIFSNGDDANDHWHMGRGGFRIDSEPFEDNQLTLQGDLYSGRLEQDYMVASLDAPYAQRISGTDDVRGGHLLGRWTRTFSDVSDARLQFYYDRTERETPIFSEDRNTYDLDWQHRFQAANRHDLVWGLAYRLTEDDVENSFAVALSPKRRSTQLVSAFLQDDITLVEDRLKLTLGSKFEHNDFTGFEIQPSARLSWTPLSRHTVWAAVSRSVRTPSRAEDDIRLNQQVFPPGALGTGRPAAVTAIFGNHSYDSEELVAYEIGYRAQPHPRLILDLALFYNDYDDLRSVEPRPPADYFLELSPGPPHLVIPADIGNGLYGETYGGELAASFQLITNRWRVQALYSYLQMQLHSRPGSAGPESDEGRSPHHQFTLRSSVDLTAQLQFDCAFRYVDSLPAIQVPSYWVIDVRLAWRPDPNFEIAVVGQNLFDDRHPEFRPSTISTQTTEVEHSVYGKVTWKF